MQDLSEGGCLLRVPVTPGTELSTEAAYTVSFSIVDTVFSIGCKVTKSARNRDDCFVGIAFTERSHHTREALTKVIELLSSRSAE